MAVVDGDHVIAWGSNVFGQLGLPLVAKHCHVPTALPTEVRSILERTPCVCAGAD